MGTALPLKSSIALSRDTLIYYAEITMSASKKPYCSLKNWNTVSLIILCPSSKLTFARNKAELKLQESVACVIVNTSLKLQLILNTRNGAIWHTVGSEKEKRKNKQQKVYTEKDKLRTVTQTFGKISWTTARWKRFLRRHVKTVHFAKK